MDNILEILVPLVFAAIYFFGNMLSGKSEEEPPSARPGSTPQDAEAAERQQQIQEEIRRKILARRQAASGGPVAAPLSVRGEALRARREEVKGRLEQHHATREKQKQIQAPPPIIRTDEAPGGFSWDESDNAYEQTIQSQMRQIEETKRRAEALKRKARASRSTVSSDRERKAPRSGGLFSGSVRDVLRNPGAARTAFVYSEVLGKPISLRKSGDGLPGQN
jgi:hypothetical protein